MSSQKTSREFVEALAHGLRVIEVFDAEHSQMTLSQVAARAGLTASTARRSLHTLEALGYVRQIDRQFVLSARILGLGARYLRTMQVDELIVPELRRIVDMFGDASSVAVLDGTDALYLAHISRQAAVRRSAAVGARFPAYASSLGRLLLAYLDSAARDTYFAAADLRKLTGATVVSRRALEKIFVDVRRVGYITVVDQLDYGITALAVPIRHPDGTVVAALNTSGYTGRVTPEELVKTRLHTLRDAAARIEDHLRTYPALANSMRRLGKPASQADLA
jgi:IclR family pca regulon transcriptional regulator